MNNSHESYNIYSISPVYMNQDSKSLADNYNGILYKSLVARDNRLGTNYADVTIDNITSYLDKTDFYTAPASRAYHDAYRGGLLYHTLRVFNNMCELHNMPTFMNVPIDSAAVCCLTHDWCKIGLYEMYQRNVKDDSTGVWSKVDSYRYKDSVIPLGHGVQSAFMASRFITLSDEEFAAIRWHMGHWDCCKQYESALSQACGQYPLVYLIQFADSLSNTSYGIIN